MGMWRAPTFSSRTEKVRAQSSKRVVSLKNRSISVFAINGRLSYRATIIVNPSVSICFDLQHYAAHNGAELPSVLRPGNLTGKSMFRVIFALEMALDPRKSRMGRTPHSGCRVFQHTVTTLIVHECYSMRSGPLRHRHGGLGRRLEGFIRHSGRLAGGLPGRHCHCDAPCSRP